MSNTMIRYRVGLADQRIVDVVVDREARRVPRSSLTALLYDAARIGMDELPVLAEYAIPWNVTAVCVNFTCAERR